MALGARLKALAPLVAVAFANQAASTISKEDSMQIEAVAIAATLLGAICFQIVLFCLTNHPDPDMRMYTYETISQTISIFVAVLVFQSVNRVVEAKVLEEASQECVLVVDMVHMLFWYAAMQAALAWISGAVGTVDDHKMDEEKRAAQEEKREIDLECSAVLLAHCTGFASINAWGAMQHLDCFSSSPAMAWVCVPLACMGMIGLQRLTNFIRTKVSMMDDGEIDEYEHFWNEVTIEAENDVMALTLSFLTTQVLRFQFTDSLPDQEGVEPWDELLDQNRSGIVKLFSCSALFIVMVLAFVIGQPSGMSAVIQRGVDVLNITVCMSFAWCTFYGSQWMIVSMPLLAQQDMLISVTLTIFVSFAAFTGIYCLDKLADADWTGDKVDEAIREIIRGIGILVGFAWEQSFDQAMNSISISMPAPHLVRTALAAFCVLVILPAWRWWILPMVKMQGWKFGFVIDPDKHDQWKMVVGHTKFKEALIASLVDDPEETDEEKHQMREAIEKMTRHAASHPTSSGAAAGGGERRPSARSEPEHGSTEKNGRSAHGKDQQDRYQQLAGDESEELRERYKRLQAELERTERAARQAEKDKAEAERRFSTLQKIFADHTEKVSGYQSRIEAQLRAATP